MLIKLTLILWSFACTLINMDGLEIVCKLKTGIIRLAGQFLHRCAPRGDAMPYPPGCPQLAQGSLKNHNYLNFMRCANLKWQKYFC